MRDPNHIEYWTPKSDPVAGARGRMRASQPRGSKIRPVGAVLVAGVLAAAFGAYMMLR